MNIQEKVSAFQNTFGITPKFDMVSSTLENRHILNIFEFEKEIKCPKDVKLADFVRDNYGEQAVQIILELL